MQIEFYLNMGLFSVSQRAKRMGLNTDIKRPDWLTDDQIKTFKQYLKSCPEPYTEKEIKELELDASFDIKRHEAYLAKKILVKYGLLEDKADE